MTVLLDWFIPNHIQADTDNYRKAQLLTGVLLMFALCSPAFAVAMIVAGGLASQVIVSFIPLVSCTALLLLLRNTVRIRAISQAMIGTMFVVITFTAYTSGGMNHAGAGELAWLVICSLLGFLLIDKRSGWIWSISVLFATALFSLASVTGYAFPNYIPESSGTWFFGLNITGLAAAMVFIGYMFDTSRQRAFDALEDEKSSVERRIFEATAELEKRRNSLEEAVSAYTAFVAAVAEGNLTERLKLDHSTSNDSQHTLMQHLGSYLNDMVDRLAAMAGQTQAASEQITSASADILAATSQQLASVVEQEATIAQTARTMTHVHSTVSQTSEHAQSVAQFAQHSVAVSEEGRSAVSASINEMDAIRERVQYMADTMLTLSDKMSQVTEIVATVNEIAAQSKLLALNAAIEAARAGEQGRGFAVVANEIRNLAEQSRQATLQVSDILYDIQEATRTAVVATEEGQQEVDAGQQMINQSGATIDNLADMIAESVQMAEQIVNNTQQQLINIEQLSTAMHAIRQAAVQTQSSTQQAEQTAQELHQMARQMQDAVTQYRL
jgi:methyl-accepting chemotaxis protein